MSNYIGEIRLFAGNYAPDNWLPCDGQIVEIVNYQGLYKHIGTTYGGDGRTNFQLPDLRGRVPIGVGQKPGLSYRKLGERVGTETVSLKTAELPEHKHSLMGANVGGTKMEPAVDLSLAALEPELLSYSPGNARGFTPVNMSPDQIGETGNGDAHQNMSPFLVVNFIIATGGYAPSAT